MKGWVYVISNRAMPNLVKVGYSLKDPELRAGELNHTGSPHPYIVDYELLTDEPREVEKQVHHALRGEREGKEWFRCSPEKAISEIKLIVGKNYYAETFKRADRAKAENIRSQQESEKTQRIAEEKAKERKERELSTKKQSVILRYDDILKSEFPKKSLWGYFFIMWPVTLLAYLAIFNDTQSIGATIIPIIGGIIGALALRNEMKNRQENSEEYKLIIFNRERELEAIEIEANGSFYETTKKAPSNTAPSTASTNSLQKNNSNPQHDDKLINYKCPYCNAEYIAEENKFFYCRTCGRTSLMY